MSAALDVAILAALPERIVSATKLYAKLSRADPGLAYATFFAAILSLDARGLVVTNEVWGKGDRPVRITVAHPHLDSPRR